YAGWTDTGGGLRVIIDHGGLIASHYCHCSQVVAKVGQTVKKGDLIAKTELSENQYCNGEISFTVKNNPQIVAQSSFYEDNSRTPMNKTLKTILTALVALMFLAGLFLLISRIILPFTKKLKTKRRKQQKKHNRSKAKRRKPKYDEAKIKEMEAKENEYFGIKPEKHLKNQDKQHNLQKGQNKENKHKKRNN
ncbi:MAG: M23 family metallopeptidase, partial [Clostridiales bacterium]